MKSATSLAATICAAFFVCAGCAPTIAGVATRQLPDGVLDAAEVGKIVGASLGSTTVDTKPPPPLAASLPTCTALAGPSTQAVYGAGWTRFALVTQQDAADYWDHSVTQTIGIFSSESQASSRLRVLADQLADCADKPVTSGDFDDVTTEWTFHAEQTSPEALQWTATQADGNDWRCYRDARVKVTALVQVAVCQTGDGRPAAQEIADRIVEKLAG